MPGTSARGRRPAMPFEAEDPSRQSRRETPSHAFLIEIAWEVCNQVGGIYQVVRSKASLMLDRWREQYCLIGPYVPGKAQLEIDPVQPSGWLARVIEIAGRSGVPVHHGRWLIQGRPRVLLLEYRQLHGLLPELQRALRAQQGVEGGGDLVDQALLFGDAVRRVLDAIAVELAGEAGRRDEPAPRLVAHFHEWQGSVALPLVRSARLPFATVFTTHATLLGRYIASSEDLYGRLNRIDHEREAERYGVRAQHAIERACARDADVFTTVSEITSEECAALLGRTPDVITPNGLSISRYNVGHDFQTFHANFKERLHTFSLGYFFPNHRFDLDRTLYMFTSGRFEPRNKGFDLCLQALAELNARLKAERSGVTVVFFIVTSRPTRSLHPLVLEKRGVLNELNEVCEQIVEYVGDELFRRAASGESLQLDSLVDEYWRLRYRRTQAAFRMETLPPIITHVLADDRDDPILEQVRSLRLFNYAEDPVKIVYHPEFIAPMSPLWGIEYEQFVRGCHFGLFPSAYEPWGYTPLECMALGTPAISSDLAGFGRHVSETMPEHEQSGVAVLRRRGRSFEQAASDLAERLYAYCHLTRRERVAMRNEVERRSWAFDWSQLGSAYHDAHDRALAALAGRTRPSS